MSNGNHSQTAEVSARIRAQHFLHDDHPLVLKDPFALHFLGTDMAQIAKTKGFEQIPERRVAAVVLGRSRYAEDCFEAAFGKGVNQYVALGAGFDSFPQRRADLMAHIQVYEIDQPATLQRKKEKLALIDYEIPANLEFLSADLEKETVLQVLERSSFDIAKPTFISWLGNTNYLTPGAIFRTLESFANELAIGSEIVFDFGVPNEFISPEDVVVAERIRKVSAGLGEPHFALFNPKVLPDEVSPLGFEVLESLSPQQMAARYFSHRSDALQPMTHQYYIHLKTCKRNDKW